MISSRSRYSWWAAGSSLTRSSRASSLAVTAAVALGRLVAHPGLGLQVTDVGGLGYAFEQLESLLAPGVVALVDQEGGQGNDGRRVGRLERQGLAQRGLVTGGHQQVHFRGRAVPPRPARPGPAVRAGHR